MFESAVCSVHCIHVCMCNTLLRTKTLFSVVNFSSYSRFLLIQVIFVDNFSLHRPFCDLVSFVEYTIEKHTLRPFLISICYPFVSSSQNMNCDCYLLLFFVPIETRIQKRKKRNVWKTGNIANYMCRSFSIFRKINARNLKKILTIRKEKYVCEFSQDFVVFQCVQCALCNVHSFTMDLYRLATLACVQFPWITK